MALALLGAMIGFAPFNRPVARLFLGDVGSLPIGLLLGWLLLLLAGHGHLAAALLLPLYYLADATITLGQRLHAGERVWEAHRSHFYQRATARGFTVLEVVARVFVVNVGAGRCWRRQHSWWPSARHEPRSRSRSAARWSAGCSRASRAADTKPA